MKNNTNRRAKIVATVGPSVASERMLGKMVEAGVDVFRFNFSHGNRDEHKEVIASLRAEAEKRSRHIAVLQDLQGPRIRVGRFPQGFIHLSPGEKVSVFDGEEGEPGKIPVLYSGIIRDLDPGMRILLSDGTIELRVDNKSMKYLECTVIAGGELSNRKGVNLPDSSISIPTITEKDILDIKAGVEAGVDMVALSFVRSADDMNDLRRILKENNSDAWIIAKLERPEAVIKLDSILLASDGVMVARGDLGVEMRPEQVPILQKRIIQRANALAVPVITATQMLESMTLSPIPTRAEASDVANAIIDGTDAVMLSAETAAGKYPIETVKMMDRIIRAAESFVGDEDPPWLGELTRGGISGALCRAATVAENTLDIKAIVACTISGSTARFVSKARPASDIIGASPVDKVLNRMALLWGVVPASTPYIGKDEKLSGGLEIASCSFNVVGPGDTIMILSGSPDGGPGTTDTMKIQRIPEVATD